MNQWAITTAYNLRMAIEGGSPEPIICQQTHDLARALGGIADVSQMTPGAAALYIIALVLSQPDGR